MMNHAEINEFAEQLINIKLIELSKHYEAYSRDHDCHSAAKEFDEKVSAFSKTSNLTVAWADEVIAFFKAYEGKTEILRYAAKRNLLIGLKEKSVKFLTTFAEGVDAEFKRIRTLPLSRQKIEEGYRFVAEWQKQSESVTSRCKTTTSAISMFVSALISQESILQQEDKIADLQSSKACDTAWCDRVDDLWKIADRECRNYETLKQLKKAADRTRLEIECKDYIFALGGTVEFETVFALNKVINQHTQALHIVIPDFDNKWQARMREAEAAAEKQAAAWYEQAKYLSDQAVKFDLFYKAAKLGHAKAMFELAGCYMHGNGVAVSKHDAACWYQKAADCNVSEAFYYLGYCFCYGVDNCVDLDKAFRYFNMGAQCPQEYEGKRDCIRELAVCYENGKGTAPDTTKAFHLYETSANKGNAAAMYDLGRCYERGIGTAVSEDSALYWYEKGESGGNANARSAANRIRNARQKIRWQQEQEQRERERLEAEQRRREEERRRQEEERLRKERLLEEERLRKQRLDEQIDDCYRRAEKGDSDAQCELAEYYYTGNGVTRSYKDAFIWFEKAAKNGNKKAMERLGDCYYNGHGVTQSFSRAEKWYNKSSK